MYTVGLCKHMEIASSCQGNDGCAMMIGIAGKSTATSSMGNGLPYFRRMPPPPGIPVPMPLCPGMEQHRQPGLREHLVQRVGQPIAGHELLDRRMQLEAAHAAALDQAARLAHAFGAPVRVDAGER